MLELSAAECVLLLSQLHLHPNSSKENMKNIVCIYLLVFHQQHYLNATLQKSQHTSLALEEPHLS